jgi:cytochrome P450
LRAERSFMPSAVDELLRFAGPSRAVFRRAIADVRIGNLRIAKGDRVVLLLSAANRDASRFANPDCLDLKRDSSGHLSFGRGTHFCAGASLVRLALTVATTTLLDAFSVITPIGDATWLDGFAIRGLSSLPAIAQRNPVSV